MDMTIIVAGATVFVAFIIGVILGTMFSDSLYATECEVRYSLVADDDGHNYIVPANKVENFEVWLEDVYMYDAWDQPTPDWITQVPADFTFEKPQWGPR